MGKCKGQFYKGRVEYYIGSRGELIEKRSLIPLRRMSCPGCPSCGWFGEELREEIKFMDSSFVELEDGKIYRLDPYRSFDEHGNPEFHGFIAREVKEEDK